MLTFLETEHTVATQSFAGSMKSDGSVLISGSPWAQFIGVDDPISQVVGSGAITVELRDATTKPRRISISALALEKVVPGEFGICSQVWELGRAVDVDDLGLGKDGVHRCRFAASWFRFASGFCTQRRQCGVFTVEFDSDENLSISKNEAGLLMDIEYEVRIPIYDNIDAVVSFKDSWEKQF